jgi:hypothetical protein
LRTRFAGDSRIGLVRECPPSIMPSASLKGECLSHLGFDDIRTVRSAFRRPPIRIGGRLRVRRVERDPARSDPKPEVKSDGWGLPCVRLLLCFSTNETNHGVKRREQGRCSSYSGRDRQHRHDSRLKSGEGPLLYSRGSSQRWEVQAPVMTGLRFRFRATLRLHDLAFEIYHRTNFAESITYRSPRILGKTSPFGIVRRSA